MPDDPLLSPPAPAPPCGTWLRLLLLPGAVVAGTVLLVLSFGRLGSSPGDAESLVAALEREGAGRWRAAVNLASLLAGPDGEALKADASLARRLAEVLRRDLRQGDVHEEQVALRVYLSRALGEFRTAQTLPVLVEAAETERGPSETDVRRSAVEALAVLAGNLGPANVRAHPGALRALLRAADDPQPALRSTAAFALGVLGGPEAEGRLVRLLDDARPEVRYNAATGLARHGNSRAEEVLLEMLRPQPAEGEESGPPGDPLQRRSVQRNALRAARWLLEAQGARPSARLAEAVRALAQSEDPAIRSLAK